MADEDGNHIQTLEQGDIWFFYRPRVEEDDPESVGDVQRLFMVLNPDDRDRYRLAIIGRKRLPDPESHGRQRQWGFIDVVRRDPQSVVRELGPERYRTKTRGERHRPAARPAGEGRYRILRHGDHTHLVYALELPREPGPVQEDLRIQEDASYILTVANPERPSPETAGLRPSRQADFPQHLRERFRGRAFAEVDPPEFLDREGAEFVMVSAHEDVQDELGIRIDIEDEDARSAEIFRELHLDRERHPVAPLLEGKWD